MRPPRRWLERRRSRAFAHRLLAVDLLEVEAEPEGEPRPADRREVLSLCCDDWVNVVALIGDGDLADRSVVLVRQWRFAVAEPTLEIPGGVVDPGEAPLDAARRELLEETGYASDRWESLGSVHPNPAILSNRCHTFLATAAKPVDAPRGDGDEEIEVLTRPLGSIAGAIAAGEISHSLVIAAFHLLDLAGGGDGAKGAGARSSR